MRHRLSPGHLPLTLVALFVAFLAQASASEPPREVTITVADDANCLVDSTKVLCADVLNQLRNVLKLPVGSRVQLVVEKTSTYESIVKVFELLQKSEYKQKMGYVNFRDDPGDAIGPQHRFHDQGR